MAKGWIRVDRSLQDNFIWKEKPFSPGQAWIDLLLLANYEDKETYYKGEVITCKRGDVNLSYSMLGDRWGWSRWKVRNFITNLQTHEMCTTNCNTHRTTITLVNYEKYQISLTTNYTTNCTKNQQQTNITNKYKQRNNIRSIGTQNKFTQIEQHEYDFEQIERELQ